MKRLVLGLVLASLPLSLLAQQQNPQPPQDGSYTQGNSRVIIMPPPRASELQDETVTPMPQPDDQRAPAQPDDTVTAPPPQGNPADQTPADNSVTATPLPPAPPPSEDTGSGVVVVPNPLDTPNGQSSGSDVQVVPNPLDSSNGQAAAGIGKPAQPQGQAESGGWIKMGTATLQALDKVNAEEKTLVVKVGDSTHFDSLDIAVQGCYVRPSDRPADATAFLVIRDQHSDSDAPAFRGWMVRSAPYMSMMAHPLYDVQVAGCSP